MSPTAASLRADLLACAAGLRIEELVALVQADLRRRWAAGDRVAVEVYRDAFPELAGQLPALLELVHAEYQLRQELGLPGASADYLRRFPELADDLRSLAAPAARQAPPNAATLPHLADAPEPGTPPPADPEATGSKLR
jgi:hypothetical protein